VYDRAIPSDALILGELGLGGELRPVSQVERRLAEAARLGWRTVYLAERGVPARTPAGLVVHGVRTIDALLRALFHAPDQAKATPAA
jgi:DNA repair protein RadA/Sms